MRRVAASDSGKIFAAVTRRGVSGTEIWQWSSDLSKRKSLWRIPSWFQGLQTNRDGSIVICQTIRGVSAYDTLRRKKLWTTATESTCESQFVGYDRYVLLVDVEQNYARSLTLLDARDGSVIDRIADVGGTSSRMLRQVYFDKNRATLEFDGGQRATYASVNNRIQLVGDAADVGGLGSAGKLYEWLDRNRHKLAPPRDRDSFSESQDVMIIPRSTHDPATICIIDRETGEVLRQDRLGASTAVVSLLACHLLMTTLTFSFLRVDGYAVERKSVLSAASR